jgi:hypothetical protein
MNFMIKTSFFIGIVLEMVSSSFLFFRNHEDVLQAKISGIKKEGNFLPADSEEICETARKGIRTATALCKSNIFLSAKLSVESACKDGREHSVTFGKDANDHITASVIIDGDTSKGEVSSDWPGAFADLHNHNNNLPPSAGDLYHLVKINKKHDGYRTRFVLATGKKLYALYLYDQELANDFVNMYLMEQSPGFSPRFPEPIFDEYDRVSIYFEGQGESRIIAQERAMAFVLSKYHTGIVLLKQDNQGSFAAIKTGEVEDKGRKTYVVISCP